MSIWLLVCVACNKPVEAPGPVVAAPPAAAAPPAPSAPPSAPLDAPPPGFDAVVRALSARDAAPPCAEIDALSPEPVDALLAVADHVPLPPQAGMRAAECLLERHPDAAADAFVRWVGDPTAAGYTTLVVARLPTLAEPVRARVLSAAAASPHADARAAAGVAP